MSHVIMSSAGHPIKLFKNSFVLDLLTCNLCFDILNDPHQCHNGHCFCKWCIEKVIEAKDECPVCKVHLSLETISSSLIVRTIINRSVVECSPHERSSASGESIKTCSWGGEFESLCDHRTKDCEYCQIQCPLHYYNCCNNANCNGKVNRKDLMSHIDSQMGDERSLVKFISKLTNKSQLLEQFDLNETKHLMLNTMFTSSNNHKEISTITDPLTSDVYTGQTGPGGVREGFGVMKYRNGMKYYGMWIGDLPSGHAYILYPDHNSVYIGQVTPDIQHPSLDSAQEIIIPQRNGFGVMVNKKGEFWSGSWKNDFQDGEGTYNHLDLISYTGSFHLGLKHGSGVLRSENGDVYKGSWVYDLRHDDGVLEYSNGDTYSGNFVKDIRQGHGLMNYKNGDTYSGDWLCGLRQGEGRFINLAESTIYIGSWSNNKQNGQGVKKLRNTSEHITTEVEIEVDCYTGSWLDNMRHGEGTYTSEDGSSYSGPWINDMMHGENGVYKWPHGDLYEGSFQENEMQGLGKFSFATGDVYIGHITCGEMDGHGVMRSVNGDCFEGSFTYGFKSGEGKMEYATGDIYTGSWDQGLLCGEGVMIYADGSSYVGEWESDNRHGRGTIKWATGDVYTGAWVDDQMCGQGMAIYTDGITYTGEWLDSVKHGLGEMTLMVTLQSTSTDNPEKRSEEVLKKFKGVWKFNKVVRDSSEVTTTVMNELVRIQTKTNDMLNTVDELIKNKTSGVINPNTMSHEQVQTLIDECSTKSSVNIDDIVCNMTERSSDIPEWVLQAEARLYAQHLESNDTEWNDVEVEVEVDEKEVDEVKEEEEEKEKEVCEVKLSEVLKSLQEGGEEDGEGGGGGVDSESENDAVS